MALVDGDAAILAAMQGHVGGASGVKAPAHATDASAGWTHTVDGDAIIQRAMQQAVAGTASLRDTSSPSSQDKEEENAVGTTRNMAAAADSVVEMAARAPSTAQQRLAEVQKRAKAAIEVIHRARFAVDGLAILLHESATRSGVSRQAAPPLMFRVSSLDFAARQLQLVSQL